MLPMLVDEARAAAGRRDAPMAARSTSRRRTTSRRFRSGSRAAAIRSRPTSPSSKAATTSAPSASCRTRAATSGCAPRPRSSPTCARRRPAGGTEVQLLGQIVNHYQAPDDPACDFAGAARRGQRRVRASSGSGSPARIRGTLATRLIEAVRDLPKVCKHLHLPVQSGSTRVLAAMRRRHTREEYLDLVARIRDGYPGRAALDRYDRRLPRRDRGRLRRDAVADRGGALPQHVLVQVLAAAEHAGVEADAGRCARGGRRRGASWRCRRCSGRSRPRCTSAAVGTTRRGAGRRDAAGGATGSCRGGRAGTPW